jgi:hypothetical protein
MVADALSHKKYCNATFAKMMQPELQREIKYLNLRIVNEAKVTMEVEPTLEILVVWYEARCRRVRGPMWHLSEGESGTSETS